MLLLVMVAVAGQVPSPLTSCPRGQSFSKQVTGQQRALSCRRGREVLRLQLWERGPDGGSFLASESRFTVSSPSAGTSRVFNSPTCMTFLRSVMSGMNPFLDVWIKCEDCTAAGQCGGLVSLPTPDCKAYIKCASLVTPSSVPTLEASYGPSGGCGASPATTDACNSGCKAALVSLKTAYPDAGCP